MNRIREDEYYEQCIEQRYFEQTELRKPNSEPEFSEILNRLDTNDNAAAYEMCEKIAKRYSDLDLIYLWRGSALSKMGKFDQVRKIIREGLKESRRKFLLCNKMGVIESDLGNFRDAVYWWIQALHCQESLDDRGQHPYAYLYLGYAALGTGATKVAWVFHLVVKHMHPIVQLKAEAAQQLIDLARSNKSEGVSRALITVGKRLLDIIQSNR